MMSPVLLDTHVFVWWLTAPRLLSQAQTRTIASAERRGPLWVSDISLWEIALLVERARLRIEMPLDVWLERATAEPIVKRCSITPPIVRELTDLPSTRRWDPGDRIVVASARVLGAKLLTSDQRIVESGLVQTVS